MARRRPSHGSQQYGCRGPFQFRLASRRRSATTADGGANPENVGLVPQGILNEGRNLFTRRRRLDRREHLLWNRIPQPYRFLQRQQTLLDEEGISRSPRDSSANL